MCNILNEPSLTEFNATVMLGCISSLFLLQRAVQSAVWPMHQFSSTLPVLNTLYLTCSFMSNISVKLMDFKWNLGYYWFSPLTEHLDWYRAQMQQICHRRRNMTVVSDYIWTSCFKYSIFIFNVSLSVCFKVYFFDYWWFHRLSLAHLRGLKHQIVMLWQEQRVSLLLHPCTIILCIVDLIWFEKMTISPNTTTYVFFFFFFITHPNPPRK